MGDFNTELCQRLKFLVDQFGQAEVARRTDTPPSTLSRYMKGTTRIPAEFVARITKALELRSEWILQGDEPPFAANVSKKSASMANNLLEIVRGMEATSRMRAGAVFGKSSMKKLHELNMAFSELKKLRGAIREEFEEQYFALVDLVDTSIAKHDVEGCERLLRSAEVFAEICPDEDVKTLLASCRSRYLAKTGRPEEAVREHARLLNFASGDWGFSEHDTYRNAANHIILLGRLERRPEALHFCRAFSALARQLPEDAPIRHYLDAQEANLEIRMGNLQDWMGQLMSAVNRMRGTDEMNAFSGPYLASLYAIGIGGMAQILDLVPASVGRSVRSLTNAITLEDREGIESAMRIGVGDDPMQVPQRTVFARVGEAMLERLDGGSPTAFRKTVIDDPSVLEEIGARGSRFMTHVLRASFLRLAGKKADSRRVSREFSKILQDNEGVLVPDVMIEAQHLKNIILTATKSSGVGVAAARSRLRDLLNEGYRCLETWEPLGVLAE